MDVIKSKGKILTGGLSTNDNLDLTLQIMCTLIKDKIKPKYRKGKTMYFGVKIL